MGAAAARVHTTLSLFFSLSFHSCLILFSFFFVCHCRLKLRREQCQTSSGGEPVDETLFPSVLSLVLCVCRDVPFLVEERSYLANIEEDGNDMAVDDHNTASTSQRHVNVVVSRFVIMIYVSFLFVLIACKTVTIVVRSRASRTTSSIQCA